MNHAKQLLPLLVATTCAATALTSAASAAKFTDTVTKDGVNASGGEQILSVGSTSIKCSSVDGASPIITFPTEQLSLVMKYNKCFVTGLGGATMVCTKGWNFHSTGTLDTGVDVGGTVTIGACSVEVVGGICKITLHEQLAAGVTYTDISGSLTFKQAISGLTYEATPGCIGFEKEGKNMGISGELKGKGAGKIEVV